MKRQDGDHHSEAKPTRLRPGGRQQDGGDGADTAGMEMMLRDPERRKTRLVGSFRELDDL
jgi:hypothetical protein